MTGAAVLLVVAVAFVAGAVADAVIESFRRARVVVDASPDHDDTLDVMDAVFPPTRAEGKDVP